MRSPWVFEIGPGGTGRTQTHFQRSSCDLHHPSLSRPQADEIDERILGLRPLSNGGRTSGPLVRPAIGGRESMTPSPVPSGRAPRFGRASKEARAPRIRVSFGALARAKSFRRFQATGTEGGIRKNPSGARRSGGVQIGPMHPWRYKGAPPRAAYVSTHCRLGPRAVDLGCLLKPFIRCLRSSHSADFSAQGTRLLRSRFRPVNCGREEKLQCRSGNSGCAIS